MGVLTKLCPFRFANPATGSIGGLCVGSLCTWYNEKEGRCVAVPAATTTAKPKTTRAKKTTEG